MNEVSKQATCEICLALQTHCCQQYKLHWYYCYINKEQIALIIFVFIWLHFRYNFKKNFELEQVNSLVRYLLILVKKSSVRLIWSLSTWYNYILSEIAICKLISIISFFIHYRDYLGILKYRSKFCCYRVN